MELSRAAGFALANHSKYTNLTGQGQVAQRPATNTAVARQCIEPQEPQSLEVRVPRLES